MLITLSQRSDKAFYQQIFDQIKKQILTGQLQGQQALPSIRNLAQELTISVITIKRAYAELEKAGYIYTKQGLGSFVCDLNSAEIKQSQLLELEEILGYCLDQFVELGLSLEEIIKLVKKVFDQRRENGE